MTDQYNKLRASVFRNCPEGMHFTIAYSPSMGCEYLEIRTGLFAVYAEVTERECAWSDEDVNERLVKPMVAIIKAKIKGKN